MTIDFSNIKLGMTRQDVINILGEPINTSVINKKRPYPDVLVYGDFNEMHYEFHFSSNKYKNATLVFVMKMPQHDIVSLEELKK